LAEACDRSEVGKHGGHPGGISHGERARFEIQGGDFRLIAAFDFTRQIAFVKFIGTHAEYDKIDALTVARY
jgi:mRNA interferase HigB